MFEQILGKLGQVRVRVSSEKMREGERRRENGEEEERTMKKKEKQREEMKRTGPNPFI